MSNYPAVPGRRMAYDVDGSIGWLATSDLLGTPVNIPVTGMRSMNNENYWDTYATPEGRPWVAIVFPQKRDLVGVTWASGSTSGTAEFLTSTNTTNGSDGTWSSQSVGAADLTRPIDSYRKSIRPLSATGVQGVRMRAGYWPASNGTIRSWHLYGSIASGQTPDRLDIWHQTTDAVIAGNHLDFGDQARATTATKSFRVKNRSSTLTAQGVTVTLDTPYDHTPSLVSQVQISLDGSTWTNTLSLGNMSAGALSSVIQVRYSPSATARLSLMTVRFLVTATGWV